MLKSKNISIVATIVLITGLIVGGILLINAFSDNHTYGCTKADFISPIIIIVSSFFSWFSLLIFATIIGHLEKIKKILKDVSEIK